MSSSQSCNHALTVEPNLTLGPTHSFTRKSTPLSYLNDPTNGGYNFITSKYHVYACESNGPILNRTKFTPHPLIMCCSEAYSKHYPLILSPDDIWLLIAQGFARHVQVHSEKLRSLFISDASESNLKQQDPSASSKINIVVSMDDKFIPGQDDQESSKKFENVDWTRVFQEITTHVQSHLRNGNDKSTSDSHLLDCNFSTSTSIEKSASQIVFMSAMKNYFNYWNAFCCGLPSITLLGTVRDWESIKERTIQLDQYGLEFWTKALIPILDRFIETAKVSESSSCLSESLKSFWNRIALFSMKSGSWRVTGWISYFFPYTEQNAISRDLLALKDDSLSTFLDDVKLSGWGTTADQYPSGLSTVQVHVLNSPEKGVNSLQYVAGFLGYDYDEQLKGMKPRIGWAIGSEKQDEQVTDD
ncbi:hypothetical protein C9374_009537 [Naegleria lovaniensis]|uniref:Uncharacterized protein n=1 Tax=Naegleria lovaniensis TaxID=51637 RepID=A0AA88GXS8_NAELO|nr:uncharacterized protein C9374_009537 [Naegleria lovaniensis]KAG2392960.1 hypothetical protein C9374_009537 [Naegleria lovaniensis]